MTNEKALPMNRLDGPGSAQNNQDNNSPVCESQKFCLAKALWPYVLRRRAERKLLDALAGEIEVRS
jgi:hypothetical protein